MRSLHPRLERLERMVIADAGACQCSTVVQDDEQPPPRCPHGRRWATIIRVVYEEAGPLNEVGHP